MFIDKVGNELFDPENVKNVRQNLTRDERNALTAIKKWENNLKFNIKFVRLLF